METVMNELKQQVEKQRRLLRRYMYIGSLLIATFFSFLLLASNFTKTNSKIENTIETKTTKKVRSMIF